MKKLNYLLIPLLISSCGINKTNIEPLKPEYTEQTFTPTDKEILFSGMGDDDATQGLLPLGIQSNCGIPYETTGFIYRRYTASEDPVIGKANYISADVDLSGQIKYKMTPYTYKKYNKKLNEFIEITKSPTVYWYFGGEGGGKKGKALDFGLAYSHKDGEKADYLAPYAQMNGDALSTRVDNKAYRIPANQKISMAFYVNQYNQPVLEVTANKIKFFDPSQKDIENNYIDALTNKIRIPLRLKDFIGSGWKNDPQPNRDLGQPLKIVHSMAYDGSGDMMNWLANRDDYFTGSSFSNIKVAKISEWDPSGSPILSNAQYFDNWLSSLNTAVCKSTGYSDKDGVMTLKAPKANMQRFSAPATSKKSTINQVLDWIYTFKVTNDEIYEFDTGAWEILFRKYKEKSIRPQSIIVTPIAKPSSGTIPKPSSGANTSNVSVTLRAECKNIAGTQESIGTISDPTGNTIPTTFPVTVTCIGPQISQPDDLTISESVGQTASGSFSFSNIGETDDMGRIAPLNYTITGSGLTISPSSGTLSKDPTTGTDNLTQTVTVSKTCDAVGNTTYPLTIASTNGQDGAIKKVLHVKVSCVEPTEGFIGYVTAGYNSGENGWYENNTIAQCDASTYASTYATYGGNGEKEVYKKTFSGYEPIIQNNFYRWADCSPEAKQAKNEVENAKNIAIKALESDWLSQTTVKRSSVKFHTSTKHYNDSPNIPYPAEHDIIEVSFTL